MNINLNYNINFEGLKEINNLSHKITDKSVLIIIDINNGFAKEGLLSSQRVLNIVPTIKEELKTFNELNLPVIAFTDCHNENSVEFKYYPRHCLEGHSESELVEELKDYDLTLIKKNSTNGFLVKEFQDKLEELLKEGFNDFIVVGCVTDICVKQFALTLRAYLNQYDLDGEVIIPINSIETFDSPIHNANAMNLFSLLEMQSNGINLVNSIVNNNNCHFLNTF